MTLRLFVGIELSQRLQECLDNCKPAMEMYFKNDNAEYLLIRKIGDVTYIGRELEQPFPCKDMDNIQRNVASLIKLVAPTFRLAQDQISIHALQVAQPDAMM